MSDTSRRKFLAAAGAGTAAGAVVSLSGGAAQAVTTRRYDAATEPVVAYVQDPKVGVLRLMVGEREVIVEDHDLVARILNAASEREVSDMSSHREAPEISKDPVADSTDVYAFVSPDRPDTVTLIANYIPLQKPDGGPNFYEFGDDVRYEINVSNKGSADADIIYRFEFNTQIRNKSTFLYNIGPIGKHRRPELEPAAVLHRDPDPGEEEDRARDRPRLPAGQRRPAQHPRTTAPSARRLCTASPVASGSSPASAPTPSTSTSAACSTSGRCGRSTPHT